MSLTTMASRPTRRALSWLGGSPGRASSAFGRSSRSRIQSSSSTPTRLGGPEWPLLIPPMFFGLAGTRSLRASLGLMACSCIHLQIPYWTLIGGASDTVSFCFAGCTCCLSWDRSLLFLVDSRPSTALSGEISCSGSVPSLRCVSSPTLCSYTIRWYGPLK